MINKVLDGKYIVYSNGQIFCIKSGRFLIPHLDKDGYEKVSINGKLKSVHRVIIDAFKDMPNDLKDPTVDHIDGNIRNNDISNLQWMERSENSSRRENKGQGELNHEAILCNKDVVRICELLQQKVPMSEIAKMFNVNKSTVSNIKRKKNWKSVTKDFVFEIKHIKTGEEAKRQRQEIEDLFNCGLNYRQILNKGYPSGVICRVKKQLFGSSGV